MTCVQKPKEFFDVPGNEYVAVRYDGVCFNRLTGSTIKVSKNQQGYLIVTLNVKGTTKTFYHHRILALTFVDKPSRHVDKSLDELEVNHIDGDKENNDVSNLEWCTPQENIDHAIRIGLMKHFAVLSRNLRTNEVTTFRNATSCARAFGVNAKRMMEHLRSKMFGRVTKDGHVFKYADTSTWPVLSYEQYNTDTWDRQFGVWRATAEDGLNVLADSLADLCQTIELSPTATQTFLNRNPPGTLCNGWSIVFDEYAIGGERRHADRKLFPAKKVIATNLLTGENHEYESRNIAAKELQIHSDRIRYAMKAKGGVVDNYQFVEE